MPTYGTIYLGHCSNYEWELLILDKNSIQRGFQTGAR
jgi:hypothetical protein